MVRCLIGLLASAGLAACSGTYDPGPETYLYNFAHYTKPTRQQFAHCYDFSCRTVVQTYVTDKEWSEIAALFPSPAATPLEERQRIGTAIARWETIVGARTGTWRDKGGDEGDRYGGAFQQDCMDEAFNTTSYLMMMRDAGLLRWHRVLYPHSRGFISALGLPHHSATIEDLQTGRLYVIDSWFYDNGQPPVIMPLEIWEKGWSVSRNGPWRGED